MADFDDLLWRWHAADDAACEAECAASQALDRHLQGLAAAPAAEVVAIAKHKRQEAQQALAEVYDALRQVRCTLPVL